MNLCYLPLLFYSTNCRGREHYFVYKYRSFHLPHDATKPAVSRNQRSRVLSLTDSWQCAIKELITDSFTQLVHSLSSDPVSSTTTLPYGHCCRCVCSLVSLSKHQIHEIRVKKLVYLTVHVQNKKEEIYYSYKTVSNNILSEDDVIS